MAESKLLLTNCLFFTAGTLARAMEEMAKDAFLPTGLNPTQGFALLCVIDEPQIKPSTIAQRLALAPSTITRVIDALKARGLVDAQSEGRASHIAPTPSGHAAAKKVRAAWKDLYQRYGEQLGQNAADQLCARINQANTQLGAATGKEL